MSQTRLNLCYFAATVVTTGSGLAVLLVEARSTAASREYTATPQFKVWTMIIVAVWAALPTVWRVGVAQLDRAVAQIRPQHTRETVRRELRRHVGWLLAGVAVVLAVAWLSAGYARPGNFQLYRYGSVRIMITYAAATVAMYPIFVTFWVVYRELATQKIVREADDARVMARIAHLTQWRSAMMTCLTTAGTIVTLGVLATGAQRQALLAVRPKSVGYPAIYVIVWGVVASVVLLMGFVPGYRRLTNLASMTVDSVFPLTAPRQDGWRDRLADRAALGELLNVGQSFSDLVNSSLVVAAPLISAVFAVLLPSGP